MIDKKTTIQISQDLRLKLKAHCGVLDCTYEELIDDLLESKIRLK